MTKKPIHRERVEQVWRGEWEITRDEDKEMDIAVCSKCRDETVYGFTIKADDLGDFCIGCGAAMTDEAMDMVMKRLEALSGETEAD